MACKSQRANKPAWARQCKMPKDSDASLRAIGPRHLRLRPLHALNCPQFPALDYGRKLRHKSYIVALRP